MADLVLLAFTKTTPTVITMVTATTPMTTVMTVATEDPKKKMQRHNYLVNVFFVTSVQEINSTGI